MLNYLSLFTYLSSLRGSLDERKLQLDFRLLPLAGNQFDLGGDDISLHQLYIQIPLDRNLSTKRLSINLFKTQLFYIMHSHVKVYECG